MGDLLKGGGRGVPEERVRASGGLWLGKIRRSLEPEGMRVAP